MRPLLACLIAVVVPAAAHAVPIVYSGTDFGVGPPGLPRPNSQAARDAFNIAISSGTTFNFESAPLGAIPPGGVVVAPGVTLTAFNLDPAAGIVSGDDDVILGYNTTGGGAQYLKVNNTADPGGVRFTFATPVEAFGAYFTGVGTAGGTAQVTFDDGTVYTFDLPGDLTGGIQFWGFTKFGSPVSQVTVQIANGSVDIFGVDDVRVRYAQAQAVPEPISLVVFSGLVLGGAGVALRRRMAKKAA